MTQAWRKERHQRFCKEFHWHLCAAVCGDQHFQRFHPVRPRQRMATEAVKVACIRDAEFFDRIEADADAQAQFEPAAMQRLICMQSCT